MKTTLANYLKVIQNPLSDLKTCQRIKEDLLYRDTSAMTIEEMRLINQILR